MSLDQRRARTLRSHVIWGLLTDGARALAAFWRADPTPLGRRPIDHVADELLSPLTVMRSTAEILRDHPELGEVERDRLVRALLAENERLERFIDLLLKELHYRPDRGEVRLPLAKLSLRANSSTFQSVAA